MSLWYLLVSQTEMLNFRSLNGEDHEFRFIRITE